MQARRIDCSLLMTIQQTTQFKIFAFLLVDAHLIEYVVATEQN